MYNRIINTGIYGYLVCSFYLKKIKKDIVVNNDIIQNITLEISDK